MKVIFATTVSAILVFFGITAILINVGEQPFASWGVGFFEKNKSEDNFSKNHLSHENKYFDEHPGLKI